MATTSEPGGDERAQRIAELKRKMQESARQKQQETAEAEAATPAAAETQSPVAQAADDAAQPEVVDAPVAVVEAVAEVAAGDDEVEKGAVSEKIAPEPEVAVAVIPSTPISGNGSNGASATGAALMPSLDKEVVTDPEQIMRSEMNRREFITYAWGAALGLLVLQTGAVSFFFMYPRFKAGEFGGKFFLGPESNLPSSDSAPIGNATGKFWLVTNEENESRALYMVCTHLGCLYKWEPSTWRFECPCHGSKFSHDGYYIEGPAPRSLDTFPLEVDETGTVTVDTGKKITGGPATQSPARVQAS